MEPFFIFCLTLVLYCGYLTIADLRGDWLRTTAAARQQRRPAEQATGRGRDRREPETGSFLVGAPRGALTPLPRGTA